MEGRGPPSPGTWARAWPGAGGGPGSGQREQQAPTTAALPGDQEVLPCEDGVCTDDDNNRRRNREQEEEKRVLARAQLGALIDLPLSNLSWVRIVCMR